MTAPLRISAHAAERLRERFEWAATPEKIAAFLSSLPSFAVYRALGGGDAKIRVPQLDMCVVVSDGVVVTVVIASTQAAHLRRTLSVIRSSALPNHPPRTGSRAKRRRRPTPAYQDEE